MGQFSLVCSIVSVLFIDNNCKRRCFCRKSIMSFAYNYSIPFFIFTWWNAVCSCFNICFKFCDVIYHCFFAWTNSLIFRLCLQLDLSFSFFVSFSFPSRLIGMATHDHELYIRWESKNLFITKLFGKYIWIKSRDLLWHQNYKNYFLFCSKLECLMQIFYNNIRDLIKGGNGLYFD